MLYKSLFVVLFSIFIMMGCSLNDPADLEKTEIGFDFKFTSIKSQVTDVKAMTRESRCIKNITGILKVTTRETGQEKKYSWYGRLNFETFKITSNKTIVLIPGTYDFILDLIIEDFRYTGSTSDVIIDDGSHVVPMSIYSVIGDVNSDFNLTQMSSLRFVYPSDEFRNIERPKVGYIINDQRELILNFDKTTGITETYINLLPGEYNIKLKLYDGRTQVGKSIKEQELVAVALKENIVMDIIPLHVETTFDLTHEGGTAVYNFIVPEEVIDEVDGVENLLTDFRLYSPVNGYFNETISLVETPDGYKGNISIDNFYYDTVAFAITFIDTRDYEVIGASGQDSIRLNSNSQQFTLQMELLRRAIVTGNILAVLGIHVVSQSGVPVDGGLVYIDDIYKGITGSDPDMTCGYLKVYLKKGTHTITVSHNDMYGVATISVDPLEVNNIEIVLDTPFENP